MSTVNTRTLHSDLSKIVGANYALSEAGAMSEYLEERRGNYCGEADAVVLPANSTEVAAIVKLCADRHIPIVPQGGMGSGYRRVAVPGPRASSKSHWCFVLT